METVEHHAFAWRQRRAQQGRFGLRDADVTSLRGCTRQSDIDRKLLGRTDREMHAHRAAGLEVERRAQGLLAGADLYRRPHRRIGAQPEVEFGGAAGARPALPGRRHRQFDTRRRRSPREIAERESCEP